MWYSVASLLVAWAPLQGWTNVSGAPDLLERALQDIGGTLEKASTWAAVGAVSWVFLTALQAEAETAFHHVAKLQL